MTDIWVKDLVKSFEIGDNILDGLSFEVGCYTNLSQDHLDYFHTMDHYLETKRKFFHSGMVRNATFNADEETTHDGGP